MTNQFLRTEYHLEVYEGSFVNEPSFHLQSSTPFGAFSIGDTFNHQDHDGWAYRPDTSSQKFFIKEVEHFLWAIKGSHNAHKIMLLLEVRPYQW